LFHARVTFLKNVAQFIFPFKAVYFLGVRGLKTSSHIVYDYNTSGHTDPWSIYAVYITYTYISIDIAIQQPVSAAETASPLILMFENSLSL